MNTFFNNIFAKFPQTEVWARMIYKNFLNKNHSGIAKKYHEAGGNAKYDEKLWDTYTSAIEQLGIKKGDILVVHSSYDGLSVMGKSVNEIIDYLLDLVGEDGTLVMPAYPLYKELDVKQEYNEKEEKTLKYNPKVTPAWTGEIPNAMCGRKEAVRSLYPNNTLVAIGKAAEQMMEHNLESDLSHGKNSAWKYCSDKNAKILYIGIEPFHALSAIHIVEDCMDENWPIKGWYKKQKYEIKISGQKLEKECRVRKKFWTRYLTEQYCTRELEKNGILKNGNVEGIPLAYIPSMSNMTSFVMESVKNRNLLFYKIPKKYWKE